MVATAALGLSWVSPARGAVRHHGISVALAVLVGAVGLGLQTSALPELRRYWPRLAIVIAVPVVALPALAWLASRIVEPGPLRLGVLAAGVAPSEVASVALAALAGGSAALAAGVLVGSTVTCVLLAGPIVHVIAGSAARFSSATLLVSLVEIVAVPLLVGGLIRTRIPEQRHDEVDAMGSLLASLAVLVLIWLVASQAHLGVAYLRTGLALIVFLIACTALGAILTVRLARKVRVSLLLPVAMRDFAIAAGIASHAFGGAASASLGLYGVLVLILGAATARVSPRDEDDS